MIRNDILLKKKLREELLIGEKVLVLAERILKKAAPSKFYKKSVQNTPYFNKNRTKCPKKNSTDRWYEILLAKRCSKQQETSKKISIKLNYLLLEVILLCDSIFHCSISFT